MYSPQALATRFARRTTVVQYGTKPLSEAEMTQTAPSIFADGKHNSRSERYTYIPTIDVLRGLQKEGFEPFMVAQSKSRIEGKEQYTKHMIRMRHASQIQQSGEATEIILINSHDGASSYQMLAGMFRYACANGLVVGDILDDIRIPHKGNIEGEVIEGAFRVLDTFEQVQEHAQSMKALQLGQEEQRAFAEAAIALRFEGLTADTPAPVTADQLNTARRTEDLGSDLWTTFQRVQENVMRGGLPGRTSNGRRLQTRAVEAIDRSLSLNRALWTLADEMRKIKG